MRNKFTRSLALGMAFATAFTFTAPNASLFSNPVVAQAAVAKKAVKGTSKITASVKKATITAGKTKKVTVTLNKKQTKAVKVTLKSSKSSVAKVPASVTVKKNAKAASFKITGKKAGTATVTASFKTSANKTKKATIKVTVKAANVAVKGVSLSTTAPKVGDTLTAKTTPAGATNVASYAWYVLDSADADYTTATPVNTNKSFVVGQANLGKFIQLVITDDAGNTYASAVSSAVTEKSVELPDDQIEGKIKIEDISGLQSDGTGLIGDTLRAVVPATLGSFSNVIFYRDGVQLNSTTQNGANMQTAANRAGKYTVSVIGSDNKVYLSNSIDVVDKEAPAKITNVTIEDDYATPNIDINANGEDHEAVISVTLNKAYPGTFEIYKASDLKFTAAPVVTEGTTVTGATATPLYAAGDVVDQTAMPTTAQVAAQTNGSVLRYVDPETGAATYKFTVAATTGEDIVRGTEYKVIFDQTKITTDSAGSGSENVAPNTITAPYLETPDSISIDSAPNGGAIVISFKDKDGKTMAWMGNPNGVAVENYLTQLKVYSKKDSEMKNGTDLGATLVGNVVKGVYTTNANGTTDAFYYATAKTRSGLFGSKAVDLTSTLGKSAQAIVTKVEIEQNEKDPYAADVKLENLRGDATVYILQSNDGTTDANNNVSMVAGYNNGTFPAKTSEKVTAGTKTVTINGAIDAITASKNHYIALVIPEDETNYSQEYTRVDNAGLAGLKVSAKFSDVKVDQNATADAKAKDGKQYFIKGVDQFGDDFALDAQAAVKPTKTVDGADAGDHTVGWAAYTVDAAAATKGQITFTSGSNESVKGNTYEYKLNIAGGAQTLQCKITIKCEDNKTADSGADDVYSITVTKV